MQRLWNLCKSVGIRWIYNKYINDMYRTFFSKRLLESVLFAYKFYYKIALQFPFYALVDYIDISSDESKVSPCSIFNNRLSNTSFCK